MKFVLPPNGCCLVSVGVETAVTVREANHSFGLAKTSNGPTPLIPVCQFYCYTRTLCLFLNGSI
jgi:hypothetical protein